MFKKIIGTMALVFSFVFCQSVFAHHGWMCGEGISKMVKSLDLTDDQKAKIQPIMDQFKASMKDMGTQMDGMATEMHQMMDSPNADQTQMNAMIDKKAMMMGNMMKAKATAKMQIMAILTADQKAKMKAMMQKMEQKMAAKWKECDHDD